MTYTPNDDMIPACVAIPVYDMNVSEPVDAYAAAAKSRKGRGATSAATRSSIRSITIGIRWPPTVKAPT